MDKIENSIKIFDEIIEIYNEEHLQKELKNKKEAIEIEFLRLLEQRAEDYELVMSNSVYTSYLFSFDSRVKKGKNLKEKFIRRNDGLRVISKLGISKPKDVNNKQSEVQKELKLFEDIIGIKILTELRRDVRNVFNLIKENKAYFKDKHIKFIDLDGQPKPMKNGLRIYNIKGIYNNEYAFELQIKSKIYSAWTDIDHSLFYKNYSITPIKDTVQVAMTRIGKLLSQLEKFLYDLRVSNEDFTDKAKSIELMQRFDKEFSPLLFTKLGQEYNLRKLVPILSFLLSKFKRTSKPLTKLDFKNLGFSLNSPPYSYYSNIRSTDFELIFLETIFLNWRLKYKSKPIVKSEYEIAIQEYLGVLIDYNYQKIKELHIGIDITKLKKFIEEKLFLLMQYSNSSKVLLDYNLYLEAYRIYTYFFDNLVELSELENIEEKRSLLENLFFIYIFNADLESYWKTFNDLDKKILIRIILDIKKNINQLVEEGLKNEIIEISKNIIETIKDL